MRRYVCGFAFDSGCEQVMLIRKTRPAWQKGKLNGIGGKINPDEAPIDAMCREYEEEANVPTVRRDWKLCIILTDHQDFVVYFFRSLTHIPFDMAKTKTEEELVNIKVNEVPIWETIENLHWLIPLMNSPVIRFPITILEQHANGAY